MQNWKNLFTSICLSAALIFATSFAQAATYNVTTNADSGAGSLRNAIALANAAAGADQITFNSGLGTITLTSGQIDITETLTITGPANGQTINGNEAGRIFGVTAAGEALDLQKLTLTTGVTSAFTLAGNCTSSAGQGGAICALGNLTLSNSTISNNYTINADGGGLYVENGVLTLIDSVVSYNSIFSPTGPTYGGGVYVTNGAVVLSNSEVLGNQTFSEFSPGGGLYLLNSDLDLLNSTISNNQTRHDFSPGGGAYVEGGNVTLTNSTISGNETSFSATLSFGGGLYVDDGDVTLRNSTVTDNGAAAGRGIWMQTGAANRALTLHGAILAGNGSDNFDSPGGGGTLTVNATYSLYGNSATDVNGTNSNNVFSNLPDLRTLASYGCAAPAGRPDIWAACVRTHALNPGSPAIDAGSNPLALTTDQRGAGYPRTYGSQTDIGAVEDNAGQFRFTLAGYTVGEAGPTATITVSRLTGSYGAVSVDYATADITAIAGSDYTVTSGTLNWVDGDVANKTFTVPITNDALAENSETISLALSNPTGGAALDSQGTATLTINDDDGGPSQVQFAVSGFSVDESGLATVTVSRIGNTTGPVFVDYATSDGTATAGSDYTASSGMLTWGTGFGGDKTFTVSITHDTLIEGDETITLTLSNPQYYGSLGNPSTATLTILDNDPVLSGQLRFSSAAYAVGEGNGTATITVSRLGGCDGAASVEYGSNIITAAPNLDYASPYGTLYWSDGDCTDKTFPVTIYEDALVEGDEAIGLILFSPYGATLGSPVAATLTITDNDDAPVPGQLQFSAASYAVGEAGPTATITVSRTGGSDGAVSVDYATSDGSATTAGSDYTAASGTLNWAGGDSANKTFTVPVNDDPTVEGSETVALALSSATGGATVGSPGAATLTITDNDTATGQLQFSKIIHVVGEAGVTATITVSRVGGTTGAASVDYATSNATATAGSDYTASSGTLNWADGDGANKTFTVPVTDDTQAEGVEALLLRLTNAIGATLDRPKIAVLIIIDNDDAGELQFSAASYAVGEAGPTATITVSRAGGASGAVSVDYATSNGTAGAGSDYTSSSGTLNWSDSDGADKTFTVPVSDDALVEGNETIAMALSSPAGGASIGSQGAATLLVSDNDVALAGQLQFFTSSYAVDESGSLATIIVSRVGGTSGAVSVDFATSNGSATAGSDYTASNGTLNWPSGDDTDRTFTVPITEDSAVEADETIALALSNPLGGATLGSPIAATLTILDNDLPGQLQFSASSYTVSEAGPTATITVSRVGGTGDAVSVEYATSNGTAIAGSDYTATSGTLNWAAGDDADKIFTVPITEDSAVEADETIALALSNPLGGATLGSPITATLTVLDNDLPGQLQFSAASYTVSETGPTATITVSRVGGTGNAVSVEYTTSNGTAIAGSDYTATSGTLNWAAGDGADKTFTIPVNTDALVEGNETVNLALSNPAGGATLGGTNAAALTITDTTHPNVSPPQPIPSLGVWGLGVLTLLLGLFGRRAFRWR